MPDNVKAGGGLDDIRINLGVEPVFDEAALPRHVNQKEEEEECRETFSNTLLPSVT